MYVLKLHFIVSFLTSHFRPCFDFNFPPRSVKQRLARQLRDKEEEIESQSQKVEALRLEVRKAERSKKEVE